ncbi:unnamed protein product [Mytilus coruscus]|uniref:Uncharacterized protein n=1 Tax=Mytilus coruscus TaxID=42192 RepID=A0A6J8CGN5_MYTCO|nr:unnamed protein product [Mytilus coruscus]
MAKNAGLKRYSRMKKDQLQEFIETKTEHTFERLPKPATRKEIMTEAKQHGLKDQQRSVETSGATPRKRQRRCSQSPKKDHARTGGGPQAKPLSLAIHRTIDLCKDSAASFKGIGGVESCIKVDNSAALPEESATSSQDLFDTPPRQPLSLSASDSIYQPLPLLPAVNIQVLCPAATVVELGTLTTKKIENPKKRKATADDVYELQILYLKGEMVKQTKEMKKLDLQIELLEEMKRDKENTPLTFSQLLMN